LLPITMNEASDSGVAEPAASTPAASANFKEISGLRRQQLQLTPFVMVCAIMIADRTIL
jgi:hypothetical protein